MKYLAILLLLVLPAGASKKCQTCARDSRGRIMRSYRVKHQFRLANPCPSTGKTTGPCRTHVMDHVVPLCAGGRDSLNNLMWSELNLSKSRDSEERRLCRSLPSEGSGKVDLCLASERLRLPILAKDLCADSTRAAGSN